MTEEKLETENSNNTVIIYETSPRSDVYGGETKLLTDCSKKEVPSERQKSKQWLLPAYMERN